MTTLFISDLHLDENRSDLFNSFAWFIEEKAYKANELYILGDFFEVWVGDDYTSPLIDSVIALLNSLAAHNVKTFIMHGNRDFLIGNEFANNAKCTLLPDIFTLQLNNQTVLLMHGDSLCTQDERYMAFRKIARDPNWQQMMLKKPLAERLQMSTMLREASKMSGKQTPLSITDATPSEAIQVMEAHNANTLIHGHTHRPDIHNVLTRQGTGQRIVLGDWDIAGWYLAHNDNQFHLSNFPLQP